MVPHRAPPRTAHALARAPRLQYGGGLYNYYGDMTLSDSTVVSNTATGDNSPVRPLRTFAPPISPHVSSLLCHARTWPLLRALL